MLIINYFCIIFTVMKFVNSQNCNNDSNCDTLSTANKSLIIMQRFTRTDEKSFFGMERATQTKTVVLSHQFQISISVNVEIDIVNWKILETKEKRSMWLKLRSHLYWGCETSAKVPSLCSVSRPLATSILSIRMSKTSSAHPDRSFALCSICFLNEPGIEVLHWPRVSQNLKTFAFNVHQYLPQYPITDEEYILINITRVDLLPLQDDFGKVFVTNIALTDIPKDMSGPGDKCKFQCGLGPQCLEKVSDICDSRLHCVDGEDEDVRLCNAIRRGIIALETNSPQATTEMFDYKGLDSRVISTLNSYVFVMISVIIIIVLLVLFVCFIYRSRQIQFEAMDKSGPHKTKTTMTTSTSHQTDTSCSTCEKKSRLNLIRSNQSGRHMRQRDDLASSNHPEPLSANDLEFSYFGHQTFYHNPQQHFVAKQNQRESRANHRTRKYSKRKEAIESADWLNLFFHVSCEARHKSLATQPPPNVSKHDNSDDSVAIGLDLSTTASTCVFPVMI